MTSAVGSGKYDIKGYDLYDSKEYQVVCICACSFDIIHIGVSPRESQPEKQPK